MTSWQSTGSAGTHPSTVHHQRSREVTLRLREVRLQGELLVPTDPVGVAIFPHTGGADRSTPREQFVTRELRSAGIATLQLELLTPEEQYSERHTRHLSTDLELLSERMLDVVDEAVNLPQIKRLCCGIFAGGCMAAAALVAAAQRPRQVPAVVCRSGRPDLAGDWLPHVKAATLLLVGSQDSAELDRCRTVQARLRTAEVRTVAGASHLFEEPGAMQALTQLTRDWLEQRLRRCDLER